MSAWVTLRNARAFAQKWSSCSVQEEGRLTLSTNARWIASIMLMGALITLVVWHAERRLGLLSVFDDRGLLFVGVGLALAGSFSLADARALLVCRLLVLVMLLAYFQGSLFSALYGRAEIDAFALARLGQYLPVIYFASLTLLVRRALVFPLINSIGTTLQGSMIWVLGGGQVEISDAAVNTLMTLVLAQPLYIVMLMWIAKQRRQVIAAERAAVESKLTTIAMISHELRSPLQTIVGSIKSLERKFKTWQLQKSEYKNLDRIRFSATQLDSQLSDLLVIAKQEAGAIEPKVGIVNMAWLINEIVSGYSGAAHDRGNSLQFQVEPDCAYVLGDSIRIHQILNNLVSNAIKYTRDGEVTVQIERPDLAEDWVEFKVKDTGIGIRQDMMEAIWRPYIRVHTDSRVAAVKGNGLGLAVVRLLAEVLGGSVHVDSAEDMGTTITVRLPLPQTQESVGVLRAS